MTQIITEAPWLKPETIEMKAASRLAAYEAEFGVLKSPPIPIEHLIEAHLNLRIDWDIIKEQNGEVILACIDPKAQRIRMNEKRRDHFEEYTGTETFTFAHEVGHWEMHVNHTGYEQLSFFEAQHNRSFLCRGNTSNRLEWQANRFAAALVMPGSMVRREINGEDICRWPTLYVLKDRFSVTISALVRRLQELKLLFKSPDGKLFPSQDAYLNGANLI